jgi:hypothetical protein
MRTPLTSCDKATSRVKSSRSLKATSIRKAPRMREQAKLYPQIRNALQDSTRKFNPKNNRRRRSRQTTEISLLTKILKTLLATSLQKSPENQLGKTRLLSCMILKIETEIQQNTQIPLQTQHRHKIFPQTVRKW